VWEVIEDEPPDLPGHIQEAIGYERVRKAQRLRESELFLGLVVKDLDDIDHGNSKSDKGGKGFALSVTHELHVFGLRLL